MNEDKFLEEYEKLCRKYKLFIASCGCCDSPYIMDMEGYNWFFGDTNDFEAKIKKIIDHLKELT